MAAVPLDVWVCCQCNGPNLIPLMDEKCPVCGHDRCSMCQSPGNSYNVTSAVDLSKDALSLATSSFAVPSTSTSFSRISACSSQEHETNHIDGFNNASIITNMEGDVWNCCQCNSANLMANSPDRCPVCEHFRCRLCPWD